MLKSPPQPLPQSSSSTQTESADLVARVPHGERASKRIGRAVTQPFSTSKQPRELTEVLSAVQAPITIGQRIAVTSIRGGAGKSTAATLVGSVFASRRAEPILAVDATPDVGSLAWRLGLDTTMTASGLAPALHSANGQDLYNLDRMLPRTPQGLRVVPGGSGIQPEVTRDVTRELSRLFGVAVLDCATGLNNPATATLLADVHAIIVATPATPDGIRTTTDALARMDPAVLRNVVVAVNTLDPHGRAALRTKPAAAAFSRLGVPMVVVPYDRHLAAGGTIRAGSFAEPTITAGAKLAAWSLRRTRSL